MADFRRQMNNFNDERERFSNFVVDLRPKEIKTEVKKASKYFKKTERHLKQNLLKQNKLGNFSRKTFNWPKITWPKKMNRLTFGWLATNLKISRRPDSLRKILAAKEKAFKNYSVFKNRRLALEARVAAAETKVSWYRSLMSFVLVLLIIIIPLKLLSSFEFFDLKGLENKIINRTQLAVNNLMAATDSVSRLDFKTADSQFQNAGTNFLAAQDELNNINDSLLSLAALASDPKLKLAAVSKKFLTAGALAASLGRHLVIATDSLFNGPKDDFSLMLTNFSVAGNLAAQDAKELKKVLATIDSRNLPPEYQAKFDSLNQQAAFLADSLVDFVGAADKLKEVLGLSRDKRYLLVFQNNSELRASGGFLGSYALVDIRDGKIRNLEVPGGGSYDTEAGLNVLVAAPEPLWLVNPLWHFWDANWWPDWPTTAKNLMWFYEKSAGPTVDGVISVTPTVVEDLLAITGPIDLTKEYGLTINADNFWETVQKIVEQKNLAKTNPEIIKGLPTESLPVESSLPLEQGLEVNVANKPKKIIGDLMAKILEVLPSKLNKENLLKIITLFEENLAEKQILFYFTDPNLEAEVSARNYGGEIRATGRDYLLVVNTNIAGQKSDQKMQERIEQISEVGANGSIINTLKIYRTHTGIKNEPLTGVRNVDWLRIYVPLGSELIFADGFRSPDEKYLQERPDPSWLENPTLKNEKEAKISAPTGTKIYEENGKTVFANWLMVDPGESAVITLKYRLPFNFFAQPVSDSWLKRLNKYLNPGQTDLLPYSLLIQKQPGARPGEFASRLVLPPGLNVFWRYPENLIGTSGWEVSGELNADKYYSILLEKVRN